jgi:hypothetical protein
MHAAFDRREIALALIELGFDARPAVTKFKTEVAIGQPARQRNDGRHLGLTRQIRDKPRRLCGVQFEDRDRSWPMIARDISIPSAKRLLAKWPRLERDEEKCERFSTRIPL